jgi:diguanylate cyclase (GGDEF)-like protein
MRSPFLKAEQCRRRIVVCLGSATFRTLRSFWERLVSELATPKGARELASGVSDSLSATKWSQAVQFRQAASILVRELRNARICIPELRALESLEPRLGPGDEVLLLCVASQAEFRPTGLLLVEVLRALVGSRASAELRPVDWKPRMEAGSTQVSLGNLVSRLVEELGPAHFRNEQARDECFPSTLWLLSGQDVVLSVSSALASLFVGAQLVCCDAAVPTTLHVGSLPVMPDVRVWDRYFLVFEGLARADRTGLSSADFQQLVHQALGEAVPLEAALEELGPFLQSGSRTLLGRSSVRLSRLGQLLHQQGLSHHRDPLAPVYRRSFCEQVLLPWLQRTRPNRVTLALADLDHFKRVNDRYGHLAGDQLLQRVGWILEQALRRCQVGHGWVIRWGGEEFLLVVTSSGSSRQEVLALAERLRRSVRRATRQVLSSLGDEAVVTMSFGLACWRTRRKGLWSEHVWRELLARADQALYRAKRHGGDTVAIAT